MALVSKLPYCSNTKTHLFSIFGFREVGGALVSGILLNVYRIENKKIMLWKLGKRLRFGFILETEQYGKIRRESHKIHILCQLPANRGEQTYFASSFNCKISLYYFSSARTLMRVKINSTLIHCQSLIPTHTQHIPNPSTGSPQIKTSRSSSVFTRFSRRDHSPRHTHTRTYTAMQSGPAKTLRPRESNDLTAQIDHLACIRTLASLSLGPNRPSLSRDRLSLAPTRPGRFPLPSIYSLLSCSLPTYLPAHLFLLSAPSGARLAYSAREQSHGAPSRDPRARARDVHWLVRDLLFALFYERARRSESREIRRASLSFIYV